MRLVSFLVVGAASARVLQSQQQQVPMVDEVVHDITPQVLLGDEEVAEDIAPGIGIHFTTSYAVAAVRYQNGTTRDLVKVGDAPYIELMTRWVKTREDWRADCDRIAATPFRFEPGRWKCNWRKTSRRVRSLLGLPISRDAATLSNFLHILQTSLSEELGRPVTSFAPAIFPLDKTKEQDFEDALERAGLSSTRTRISDYDQIAYQDADAAYAGLGHGLCKQWTDYQNCIREEYRLPYHDVLFLSYDNSSFTATAQTLQTANQDWPSSYAFNLDLGWWNLPIHEVPRARFWANVHEMIVDAVSVMSRPPSRIVLMGEHGGDEEFKAVVEAALWSVLDVDVDMMLQDNRREDTARVAARGAAELAWRSQYWNRQGVERRLAGGAPIEL